MERDEKDFVRPVQRILSRMRLHELSIWSKGLGERGRGKREEDSAGNRGTRSFLFPIYIQKKT